MNIRTKISLSLAFCILILVVTVAIVLKQLDGIEFYRAQASLSQDELIKITDFRAKVRRKLLSYYEAVLDPTMKAIAPVKMINISSVNDSERELFEELNFAFQDLSAKYALIQEALQRDSLSDAQRLLISAKAEFDQEFIPKITSLIALKDLNNSRNSQILKENIQAMKRNLLILTSISLLVTIILATSLGRFLNRKFTTIENGTNEIGKGNTDYRLEIKDNDELTKVSQSFNQMLEALKTSQGLLLQQQQQLLLASKASALGEVATGMGHEINNPLSIVMTSTSLLKKRLEKESPDKAMNIELVSEVKDAATRISKIVNGIRMITRNAEADSLAKVSLSKLISDTIDLCQEKFNQQGIDLKFINHLSLTEPDILECRSVEITQVLINLINNAYDAIENLSERWLRIELSSEGNNFYLSLTDSGKGIPEEVQDKMMNPFFTTKEIGKGTGLGLTISKGVIEKYHGHLRMEKTSPNTKFVISLPRQQS